MRYTVSHATLVRTGDKIFYHVQPIDTAHEATITNSTKYCLSRSCQYPACMHTHRNRSFQFVGKNKPKLYALELLETTCTSRAHNACKPEGDVGYAMSPVGTVKVPFCPTVSAKTTLAFVGRSLENASAVHSSLAAVAPATDRAKGKTVANDLIVA